MLNSSVVFSQAAAAGWASERHAAAFIGLCQAAVWRLLSDRSNKGQNEAGSDAREDKNRSFTFISTV